MLKTITINREQLFNLLQNDIVKEVPAKWGVNVIEHVIYEDKDYVVVYNRHDGIQGERFVLMEAELKTKTITEWAVKED